MANTKSNNEPIDDATRIKIVLRRLEATVNLFASGESFANQPNFLPDFRIETSRFDSSLVIGFAFRNFALSCFGLRCFALTEFTFVNLSFTGLTLAGFALNGFACLGAVGNPPFTRDAGFD